MCGTTFVATYDTQVHTRSILAIMAFQAVQGVPAVEGELNPATWMLEITTPGMEHHLGVDFAEVYRDSQLAR